MRRHETRGKILWRISKWSFIGLVVLIMISAVVIKASLPTFKPNAEGCYWTDALVVYIECRNVEYGEAIEFISNLPLLVLYTPMFVFSATPDSFISSSDSDINYPAEVYLIVLSMWLLGFIDVAFLFMGSLFPLMWIYSKIASRFPAPL